MVYVDPLRNRMASSPRWSTTRSTWWDKSDAMSTSTCSRQRANAALPVLREVGDLLRSDAADADELSGGRQRGQQTLERRAGRGEQRLAGLTADDAADRARGQPTPGARAATGDELEGHVPDETLPDVQLEPEPGRDLGRAAGPASAGEDGDGCRTAAARTRPQPG